MTHKSVNVLVFDDEPLRFRMLKRNLRSADNEDITILWSTDGEEVTDETGADPRPLAPTDFLEGNVDLILVDLKMSPKTPQYGDYGGLVILKRLFALPGHCRSVVATTQFGEVIRDKPDIQTAIDQLKSEEDLIVIDTEVAREPSCSLFRQIIASRKGRRLLSPQVERQILFLGRTDEPVLILGDRGSGKEGTAKSIHRAWCAHKYGVARRPFESLNAGAFDYHLMRSEMFGYGKGAYTGALGNGAVGAAFRALDITEWGDVEGKERLEDETVHAGTLFLDEIGNVDPACQGVLLRFLEDPFAASPVGHPEVQNVRPRVIAATNDIGWIKLAKTGIPDANVRPDLFDRVARNIVCLPHLKADDVYGFVRVVAQERWDDGAIRRLAELVDLGLIRGNVRGLVNFIKRTELIRQQGGDIGWKFDRIDRSVVELSLRLAEVPVTLLPAQTTLSGKGAGFWTPKGNLADKEHVAFALRYALSCEEGTPTHTKEAPGSLVDKHGQTQAEIIFLTWFAIYDDANKPETKTLEDFKHQGAVKWFVSKSRRAAHRTVEKTAKRVLGVNSTQEIYAKARDFRRFCINDGVWPSDLG